MPSNPWDILTPAIDATERRFQLLELGEPPRVEPANVAIDRRRELAIKLREIRSAVSALEKEAKWMADELKGNDDPIEGVCYFQHCEGRPDYTRIAAELAKLLPLDVAAKIRNAYKTASYVKVMFVGGGS